MGFRRNTTKTETKQETKGDSSKGKSGKASNFVKVGTLMTTKDGEKIFLKIMDPADDKYAKFSEITVDGRKVKGVTTDTVEDTISRLVERGVMTEEEGQARLAKIPSTILAEVTFILED